MHICICVCTYWADAYYAYILVHIVLSCTVQKFRVEWKQLYPWLDYNNGKMFCFWCCEYGNFSNASSSVITGRCTNLKIDSRFDPTISQLVTIMWSKPALPKKKPAAAPLGRAVRIVSEESCLRLLTLWLN